MGLRYVEGRRPSQVARKDVDHMQYLTLARELIVEVDKTAPRLEGTERTDPRREEKT